MTPEELSFSGDSRCFCFSHKTCLSEEGKSARANRQGLCGTRSLTPTEDLRSGFEMEDLSEAMDLVDREENVVDQDMVCSALEPM